MEKYSNTKYNLLAILVGVIIATIGVATADYDNGTGMALLVLIWLPLLVGVITLGLFFLIRTFAPKFAWVPTLLGVVFLLMLALSASRG